MNLVITKPKIWKELSYPLKSSILQNAMDENGIDCYTILDYWVPQRRRENQPWNLIDAEFWLPNFNVNYPRFFIRAGVVKSQDRKLAEHLLIHTIIPELIDWMKANLEVKEGWTRRPKEFSARYIDGELIK